MERIANGDARAFDALVRTHLSRAYGIARRVLINPQDAEDAVQDAFTKIWTKATSWQPGRAAFTTWMYRVVVNSALDIARKRQNGTSSDEHLLASLCDTSESNEHALIDHEERRAVHRAIATLTPAQRTAVSLCYFEELTNEQAAVSMGIHLKALEALLVRARRALRNHLPLLEARHAA